MIISELRIQTKHLESPWGHIFLGYIFIRLPDHSGVLEVSPVKRAPWH